MRKILNFLKVPLLFTLMIGLFSCGDDDSSSPSEVGSNGDIVFSYTLVQNNMEAKESMLPVEVYVTVESAEGNIVLDKYLTLSPDPENDGMYITDPISMPKAKDYSIENFVVYNELEAIYVTPKEGSETAELVSDPLPYKFEVLENQKNIIKPEVILVDSEAPPSLYGYSTFGFVVQETVDALFVAMTFNETDKTWVQVPATLKIQEYTNTGNTMFEGTMLEVGPTVAKVKDEPTLEYFVTVSATGYTTTENLYNNAEIQQSQSAPITIVLK